MTTLCGLPTKGAGRRERATANLSMYTHKLAIHTMQLIRHETGGPDRPCAQTQARGRSGSFNRRGTPATLLQAPLPPPTPDSQPR